MNPTCDLKGQVALVTGAASGMGLATAKALAEAGAAVVLADFRGDAATAAVEAPVAAGHKASGVACDVSDDEQVAALVDRTVAEFGRLDLAFNTAAVTAKVMPIAESTAAEWERVIGVNLRGVWSCLKHELRRMQRQGSGAIVDNASVGALDRQSGHRGSYCLQARRDRPDTHGGAGICRQGHLRERGPSWRDRFASRARRGEGR